MSDRKSIVVSIPLVWCYRNIFLSGIYSALAARYDVYLAVPEVAYEFFVGLGIDSARLLILTETRQSWLYKWILRVLKRAYDSRNAINTGDVFRKLASRRSTAKKLSAWLLYGIPALLCASDTVYDFMKWWEKTVFVRDTGDQLAKELRAIDPAFVLSTANVVAWEWPLFRTAQNLGIDTIAYVLSFDNITSRSYLPIAGFNQYFVWNEQMKTELVEMHGVEPGRIHITGTAQFDFHIDRQHTMTREELLAKIRIPTEGQFYLYCANHHAITPDEPTVFEEVIRSLQNAYGSALKPVIRLHPMDDYSRWNEVLKRHPGVILNIPWQHDANKPLYWGEPSVEDMVTFSNLVRHASVVLTVGSTIAIDAAILDTPVICLGFHPYDRELNDFYRNLHRVDHYRPIMETRASPLAKSVGEVISFMEQDLSDRTARSEERRALVEKYLPYGRQTAANRISRLLMHDRDQTPS